MGNAEQMRPEPETFDHVYDLQDQLVLPGLIDSHIHVALYGQSFYSVNCQGCASISELQQRLKHFLQEHPGTGKYVNRVVRCFSLWVGRVYGVGWEQDKLGRYPTKHDLDAVCDDIVR